MGHKTRLKLVTVGDDNVGKRCLLLTYSRGTLLGQNYIPTASDEYCVSATVDKKKLKVALRHMMAQARDYDRIRLLDYQGTNVFLLCFSVSEPASFASVETFWVPDIRHHCPEVPVVLVATKVDLRYDQETIDILEEEGQAPISFEQGIKMKEKVGGAEYFECSSLTDLESVQEVFLGALRAALRCTSKR